MALVTTTIWGLLAMALKVLVVKLDPFTVTWIRFVGAGCLMLVVGRHGRIPSPRHAPGPYALLLVATCGIAGNFVLFLAGLRLTSPATAQLVSQLAPLFLMAGSMVVFGERFQRLQWVGLASLVGGLLLYFGERTAEMTNGLHGTLGGVLLIGAGAASWTAYALAQKQLLRDFTPDFVLAFVYLAGSLLLLPPAQPHLLLAQSWPRLGLLVATIVVTLVSYRCFSGALQHLEGSRVGVVISLTPLITLVGVTVASSFLPDWVQPERLGAAGLAGALLVVAGSALTALARRT